MKRRAHSNFEVISFSIFIFLFWAHLPARAGVVPTPIRINIDDAPVTLEPPLLTDTIANWVILHIGERLIEEHSQGEFVSNIAKSWSINSDFTIFDFQLKPDKTFSDGTPINADNVVASLKETVQKGIKGRIGIYLKEIKNISSPTKDSIKIELKHPIPFFLHILADPMMTVFTKKNGANVFSGGYRMESITKKSVVLVRTKDNQKFELLAMPFKEASESFKACRLDVIQGYAIYQSNQIKDLTTRSYTLEYGKTYFIAFNTTSKFFNTIEQRRDFLSQTNQAELYSFLGNNNLTVLSSLLPPNLTMGRPDFKSKFQLGREPENFKVAGPPIKILTQKSHELSSFVKAIMGTRNFTEIALNKAEWLNEFKSGKYDLMLMGFGLTVRDWDAVSTWFETDAHFNFARIKNIKVDELLKTSRGEINPQKRVQNYIKLIQMNDENFWYIPLTEVPLTFGLANSIGPVDFQNRVILSPFLNLDTLTKKSQMEGSYRCN